MSERAREKKYRVTFEIEGEKVVYYVQASTILGASMTAREAAKVRCPEVGYPVHCERIYE